jgi:hypothetical protein
LEPPLGIARVGVLAGADDDAAGFGEAGAGFAAGLGLGWAAGAGAEAARYATFGFGRAVVDGAGGKVDVVVAGARYTRGLPRDARDGVRRAVKSWRASAIKRTE